MIPLKSAAYNLFKFYCLIRNGIRLGIHEKSFARQFTCYKIRSYFPYMKILKTVVGCIQSHFHLGPSINGLVTNEIQSYVVEALFLGYFKELEPIKLILNIHEIIRDYYLYAKLKYYKLKSIELKFSHLFMLISDDFRLKMPKLSKKGT